MSDDRPVWTPRVCRCCGEWYYWPKGSRITGDFGPCCQLSLFDPAEFVSVQRLRAALGRRVVGGVSVEEAVAGR